MPRLPVMAWNCCWAFASVCSAVCSWCSRAATSWIACAIAPTSTTAHCARLAGLKRIPASATDISILTLMAHSLSSRCFDSSVLAGEKARQPRRGLLTVPIDQAPHALDVGFACREHGKLAIEALQIEFRHDRVVALLDQEHARAGWDVLLDEPVFPLGEIEAGI